MDKNYKEIMTMPNKDFPIKITHQKAQRVGNIAINTHWHREIELLYLNAGSGQFRIGNQNFIAHAGDLIIVNCNEMHSCLLLSETLVFDCIILDPYILNSRFIDLCDSKYITPIIDNRILFNHHIVGNSDIQDCIRLLDKEYTNEEFGYELAIKSTLFQLIVLLMRHYITEILTDTQIKYRMKNIERFNEITSYIESHFSSDLTVDNLCDYAHISKYHFCRMFKQMTGHTVIHFINSIRIQEADSLLIKTELSISEIAFKVGYHDTSYFSRLYKKFKNYSPTQRRIELNF